MRDNTVIGVIGQSGSGKTTWVRSFIHSNTDYELFLLLDVTNQFPQFRIAKDKIFRYSKFQDAAHLNRILHSVPQSMYKLIIFDDADLTLRGSDFEFIFLYHRNYNADIIYTSKRLKGMNTKIQFQTRKLIIFKYNRQFIRDLLEFGFDREFAERVCSLNKFEFVEVDI